MTNNYRIGSLAWVERNRANVYREMIEAMIAGEMSTEEARKALYVLDSDSASF